MLISLASKQMYLPGIFYEVNERLLHVCRTIALEREHFLQTIVCARYHVYRYMMATWQVC